MSDELFDEQIATAVFAAARELASKSLEARRPGDCQVRGAERLLVSREFGLFEDPLRGSAQRGTLRAWTGQGVASSAVDAVPDLEALYGGIGWDSGKLGHWTQLVTAR